MSSKESEKSEEGLSGRVGALEDAEAIRSLKYRYADAVDRHLEAPSPETIRAIAGLFTEDASADYGQFGSYQGQAQIAEFFSKVLPSVALWTRHFMLNPILDLAGATAKGRWYAQAFAVLKASPAAGPQPLWVCYEETYKKTDSGWRFSSIVALFDQPPTAG